MSLGIRLRDAVVALLIGAVCVGVAVAIARLALVPAVAAVLGLDEETTSIVRRVIVTIAMAIGFYFYLRFAKGEDTSKVGFNGRAIFLAGAGGMGLMALIIGINGALGGYSFALATPDIALIAVFLAIFGMAFLEEVVFRGVLFSVLERNFGLWIALLLPSLTFSLLHLLNDSWGSWFAIAIGFLLGVLWSLVYWRTGNIWAAGLNHALWNYTIVISGLPLTGQTDWIGLASLSTEIHGPSWLSGGAARPEETVVAVIVTLLAIALLLKPAFVGRGNQPFQTEAPQR